MVALLSSVRSVYWSSWVLSRWTSLKWVMKAARASSPFRLATAEGVQARPWDFMKLVELLHGGLQLLDDHGGLVHEPDFPRLLAGLLAGEEGDGGIHGVLLLAEVEDVAVGLGAVEHAVGAGEGLDQAVVLEVLVHVERVQELGIEAGEQHVHHDGDVDLLRGRVVGIGPLLVFDALLHILVVEVELAEAVIGAVAGVVVGEDGLERGFLALGVDLVVRLLLRQVFLNLLHIRIALGGRGEDAGDVQRLEVGVGGLPSPCIVLNSAWYSMASLMDAVARMALKRRPPVAASCFARISFDDGALAMASPGFRRVFALDIGLK
jgi:hypothetical protein